MRYSSASITFAPWPAAMRAARTPPEPPPMTKRSTSNAPMRVHPCSRARLRPRRFADLEPLLSDPEPYHGGSDRRGPPALPGAVPNQRDRENGREQRKPRRQALPRQSGERTQRQEHDEQRQHGSHGAQLGPDLDRNVVRMADVQERTVLRRDARG